MRRTTTAKTKYLKTFWPKSRPLSSVVDGEWTPLLGQNVLLLFREQIVKGQNGDKNPRWKGGRRIRSDGYVVVYSPGHPSAYKNFVLEHRLVMEAHLGRYLDSREIVHHKNENRSDNRLENL